MTLAAELQAAADLLASDGEALAQRFEDWRKLRQIPTDSTRGGGVGDGLTDRALEDRLDDARAARYADEYLLLTRRLWCDARRLQELHRIAFPDGVPRERVNSVPACVACGEPVTGRVLRGMDEACHRAWKRAGQPDLTTFKRDREEVA